MTDLTQTFQTIAKERQQLAASKSRLNQEGRWLFLSWKEKQRQEKEKEQETINININQPRTVKKTPAIALALEIQRKIELTQGELQRLGKLLSKQFSAFDDGDISRSLAAVGESITEINQNLRILEQLIQATANNYVSNQQTSFHVNAIVESLKAKSKGLASDYQKKQDLRLKNLETQSRISSVFNGQSKPKPTSAALRPSPLHDATNHPHTLLQKPTSQPPATSSLLQPVPAQHPQQSQQQVQVQTTSSQASNDEYSTQRLNEITRIQRTVEEVAGMYRQLADFVWAQQTPIESIYANVSRAERDVEKGQDELITYRSRLASNKGLIVKVLATLIFFVLFFFFFLL